MVPEFSKSREKLLEITDECENINECDLNDDLCPEKGQVCSDTEGSFECVCDTGYEQVSFGSTCIDIDECSGRFFKPFERNLFYKLSQLMKRCAVADKRWIIC